MLPSSKTIPAAAGMTKNRITSLRELLHYCFAPTGGMRHITKKKFQRDVRGRLFKPELSNSFTTTEP